MDNKVPVSFRAALARYSRHLSKNGEKLITFRTPLDSIYSYGIVDVGTNALAWKGTDENLIDWMREAGTLKAYEVIADNA